jgi:hypothetical protein
MDSVPQAMSDTYVQLLQLALLQDEHSVLQFSQLEVQLLQLLEQLNGQKFAASESTGAIAPPIIAPISSLLRSNFLFSIRK